MLLALAAIWTGVDLAGEPYRAAMEFRHAGECPSGAAARGSGCMGHESGPVVDKSILVGTDSDTDCYLSVERTSGGTKRYDVSGELYNAARLGFPADLKIWHSQVVGITVRGERDNLDPCSVSSLLQALLVVWAGAGLVLWSALGGGRLRVLFGWMGIRALAWWCACR
jgi:hypothetical protein